MALDSGFFRSSDRRSRSSSISWPFLYGHPYFRSCGNCLGCTPEIRKKACATGLGCCRICGSPTTQYAYSRADLEHVSLGTFPLILGCFLSFDKKYFRSSRRLHSRYVLRASGDEVAHEGWRCHVSKVCVDVEISGRTQGIDLAWQTKLLC